MSPINLERDRGLGYWENDGIAGDNANANAKECIDVHWMKVSGNCGRNVCVTFDIRSHIMFSSTFYFYSTKIVGAVWNT
jgi:hypothetical protein